MRFAAVMTKYAVLLSLLMSALASNCSAQKSVPEASAQPQPTVASFAGCYELTLGRWWPWGFGSDVTFFTPPHRVSLVGEPGTQGFEQNGLLLRALPDPTTTRKDRGGPSYWNVGPPNEITLTWTDGFTGITINLRRTGKELRGWAHPHSDAPTLVHHIAHVIARPIDCGTTK
jgi:hypothetical protein